MSGSSIGGFSGPYTVNPNGTVRSHAGNEYSAAIADRPNIRMETGAFVERITFDNSTVDPRATGVQYSQGNVQHTVTARKEVILAAGPFQTPQLLELSDIGGQALLDSLRIPLVVDNPHVGENLPDHATTGVCAQVREGFTTGDLRRDPAFLAKAREMYAKDRAGPLTAGFLSFAFLSLSGWADDTDLSGAIEKHLDNAPQDDTRPTRNEQAKLLQDLISSPSEASVQLCFGASQVYFDKSTYGDFLAVTEPENYAAILVSLPHPFSAGTCHIATANPKVLPTVDPRFMSNPLDAEVLGRHMACLDKLFETKPLSDLIEPGGIILPASSPLFEGKSGEAKLETGTEHSRRYIRSTSHPVGTASMLPREKGRVVD